MPVTGGCPVAALGRSFSNNTWRRGRARPAARRVSTCCRNRLEPGINQRDAICACRAKQPVAASRYRAAQPRDPSKTPHPVICEIPVLLCATVMRPQLPRCATMPYNLVEAGIAIGKNKSTVLRAIRRGVISATRDPANGSWLVDPAELHRVFPPRQATAERGVASGNGVDATGCAAVVGIPNAAARNQDDGAELRAKLEAAERIIRDKEEQIADLRHRLDEERVDRRQTADRLAAAQERVAALLSSPPATTRRRWWSWR